MRYFHGVLFCGSPDTKAAVRFLHQQLDEALSHLSGLQQSYGEGAKQYEPAIEDTVRDIAAALTGKSIEFKETLPYPWVSWALADRLAQTEADVYGDDIVTLNKEQLETRLENLLRADDGGGENERRLRARLEDLRLRTLTIYKHYRCREGGLLPAWVAVQWHKFGDCPHYEVDLLRKCALVSCCSLCGRSLETHGWLVPREAFTEGNLVCPGDYIITRGRQVFSMQSVEFEAIYEEIP